MQETPVLCAQPPTSLGYAAKGWHLQPSSEACIWAARAASLPESQSWKCLGDYTLSGQPVANLLVHRWQVQLCCFHTGTTWHAIYGPELRVGSEGGWHFIWYCSFGRLFSFLYPVSPICLPFSTGRISWIKPLVLESNLKYHGSPFWPQRCQEMELGPQIASSESFRYSFRTWVRKWGLSFL